VTSRDDAWDRRFIAKEIREAGDRYSALAAGDIVV
jgi:hypothetical protein